MLIYKKTNRLSSVLVLNNMIKYRIRNKQVLESLLRMTDIFIILL